MSKYNVCTVTMATHAVLLLMMTWIAYCANSNYKDRLFKDPGIVWLENTDGVVYFQHMYIDSNTWRNKVPQEAVPIARTRKGEHNFTHFSHVDMEGNKTFVMVDATSRSIMALTFDSLNQYTYAYWELFVGTSTEVNGIAVDWVTDVVYWTDAAYDVILAVSMGRPNMVEVIVDDDLDEPYGIVTYPEKGFLFWTDASETRPRLMRSSLGGSGMFMVLSFLNLKPSALYLDYMADRLYWLYERRGDGAGVFGIGSCDSFGNDVISRDLESQSSYYDMSMYNGQHMFIQQVYESTEQEISYYKPGLLQTEVYVKGSAFKTNGWTNSILVLDPVRQLDGKNPCLKSHCPGICTRSNNTEECFCNQALKKVTPPNTINKYCGNANPFKGFLIGKGDGIYTIKTNFVEYQAASSKANIKPVRILNGHQIRSMASDVRSSKVFYYEKFTKVNVIKSQRIENNTASEVFSLAVDDVGGLAFDSFTKNLYWTDTFSGHIMVAKEDGSFPFVLLRELRRPKAIVVHPSKRLLIWSELRSQSLWRSFLDGSDVNAVLARGHEISDITIDFSTDKLYWCERLALFEANLNGSNIRMIYKNAAHYFTGVTILHDYVVVSDTNYRTSGLYVFHSHNVTSVKSPLVGNIPHPPGYHSNWYSIDYHHSSNQPDGISECTKWNQTCDQLCLPGRYSVRCVCSVGYKKRGPRCEINIPPQPYILVTDQRYQKLFQIHAATKQFVAIPAQGLRQPLSITYDPVKELIYWSDIDAGIISRIKPSGDEQEVIIFNPDAYFVTLVIDPGSRLMYYLEYKPLYDRYGSLIVYNIDTGKTDLLVEHALDRALGLALNIENGYVFVCEKNNIWRVNKNDTKTDFIRIIDNAFSRTIASIGQYMYFASVKPRSNYYERSLAQIIRSDLNGDNITVLLTFIHSTISSLTVDKDYIYWINRSTRGVQRTRIEGPYTIENVGPSKVLFRPAGLFVNPIGNTYESQCSFVACLGLCLPSPDGPVCLLNVTTETVNIRMKNKRSDLCRIPVIRYGDVVGNKPNRVVPNGYKARIKCYPAHKISRDEYITCRDGGWSHIPHCTLKYDVCGTPSKGYKVYRESGEYFVYQESTKISVICIGGGGGGYDVNNDEILNVKAAGDGDDSSFGRYLNAFGGKGGTATKGGSGGSGHYTGGSGSIGNCSTGGTAGQSRPSSILGMPGYSTELFCGAGGYSYGCNGNQNATSFGGPGGTNGNSSDAGYFGGGAGAHGGGTGGGGGWSSLVLTRSAKEIVPVIVGKAGYPSYGQPGPGLVVVMWGSFRADDFVDQYDIINNCVL